MFWGRSGDRGFYLGHLWDGNRARDHVFYPPGDETNILLIGPPGSGNRRF